MGGEEDAVFRGDAVLTLSCGATPHTAADQQLFLVPASTCRAMHYIARAASRLGFPLSGFGVAFVKPLHRHALP